MAASQASVISNTTPLINLVGVRHLDLLPSDYAYSTPPQSEQAEKPKEKKWLSLKNEALWAQMWTIDR